MPETLTAPSVETDLKERLKHIINISSTSNSTKSSPEKEPVKNPFWSDTSKDFKDELPPPIIKKKETEKTDPDDDDDEKTETTEADPGVRKLTHDEKQGSADTNVGMCQLTVSIIATPIIQLIFKSKFSNKEIQLMDSKNILDRPLDEISEDDEKILKRKFDRLVAGRDKKLGKVTFDPKKEAELHKAFYNYAQVTGKVADPKIYLTFAIINTIASTVVDIVSTD